MKKLLLLITLMTLSPTVLADGIDVKAAWGDALTLVSMKFILAAVVFYILSFGLWGKARNTAVEYGRWIGAFLAAISIVSATTLHKTDIDLYVGGAIMTVVWFAIGFVIGYVWFKFKNVKADTAGSDEGNFKKYIKAFSPILLIIGFGIVFWLFMYSGINSSNKSASSEGIGSNSTSNALMQADAIDGTVAEVHSPTNISLGGFLSSQTVTSHKVNGVKIIDGCFDYDGAQQLGMSYSEVNDFISSKVAYDLQGARNAGITDLQIYEHFATKVKGCKK